MKHRNLFFIYPVVLILLSVITFLQLRGGLGLSLPPLEDFPRTYQLVAFASYLLMGLVVVASLSGIGYLFLRRSSFNTVENRLADFFQKPAVRIAISALLLVVSLASGQLILQTSSTKNEVAKAFLQSNQPQLIWLIAVSLVSLLVFYLWNGELHKVKNPEIYRPLVIFGFLMAALVVIDISRFGFQKYSGEFGNFRLTGFPILDYQIILAWLVAILGSLSLFWLFTKLNVKKAVSPRLLDVLISAGLFLVAFYLWNKAPIIANAFIDKPRPPNFHFYPNLDAVLYDRTALSLLATGKWQTYIGGGDALWIGRRPLLALFLVGLHWITDSDYTAIIQLQILFFSILPSLVYLFTKRLHSRAAGVLTALVIIFRHLNGVWLQEDVWGGTSLQMLMSDIPAMIFVVLFLYLILGWVENPNKNFTYFLICGGVVGLGMLIRQELVVLLVMVVIVSVPVFRGRYKKTAGQIALMIAGMIIVITPWLARNYALTGMLFLDKPGKGVVRAAETLGIYDWDQSQEEVRNRRSNDRARKRNLDTEEIPGRLELITNHFANSIPQVFLYLPSNPVVLEVDYLWRLVNNDLKRQYGGLIYSPYSYAKSLPYWWWDQWDGKVSLKSWIPLSFNMFLISVGLFQVWKRKRWSLFVPLLSLAFMISVYALIRGSGGRWLQTVDWISSMFLAIGLVHLSLPRLMPALESQQEKLTRPISPNKRELIAGAVVFLVLVMIGATPVILEAATINPYTEDRMEQRIQELITGEPSILTREQQVWLGDFMASGGEVLYGEALYPRYFPPGEELMSNNQTLFPSSLTFTVAGTEMGFVVLPQNESLKSFPQLTETLVAGCWESTFPKDPGFPCLGCIRKEFEAALVIQYSDQGDISLVVWQDGILNTAPACPLIP